MSKATIGNKLTVGKALGANTSRIADLILANEREHKAAKAAKTAPLTAAKWEEIAAVLATLGAKNCEYAEGLARRFGVTKEQAQSVIDEIEGAIE